MSPSDMAGTVPPVDPQVGHRRPTIGGVHPRWPSPRALLVAVLAAAAVLGVSWAWASKGIGTWELDVVEVASAAADPVWWLLWPVMQLGTVVGVVVVGGALWWTERRPAPVVMVVAAAVLARTTADVGKDVMGRARPPAERVTELREAADGFGYPSSHTATAAAIAVAAWPWLSDRARVVLVTLAALVGLARIVGGVHLPLDIVGGAAIGVLAGAAVLAATRAVLDRRAHDPHGA